MVMGVCLQVSWRRSVDPVGDDALDDGAAQRVHRRLEARVHRTLEERPGGLAVGPVDDELEAAGLAPIRLGAQAARSVQRQRPALGPPPGGDRVGLGRIDDPRVTRTSDPAGVATWCAVSPSRTRPRMPEPLIASDSPMWSGAA